MHVHRLNIRIAAVAAIIVGQLWVLTAALRLQFGHGGAWTLAVQVLSFSAALVAGAPRLVRRRAPRPRRSA